MLTTKWILDNRPIFTRPKPDHTLLGQHDEWEATGDGHEPARVRTLFLRGSECRFHCTMCDLWQYTHIEPTGLGDIPAQIRQGLSDLSSVTPTPAWLKLYNASSFFDSKNVPVEDLPWIARLVSVMQRVIVENHPRLTDRAPLAAFSEQIQPARLELAMGLETVHEQVLQQLNKQMTVADFRAAVGKCHTENVSVRAFVLLQTPWLDQSSALHWCQATVDAARDMGVQHVSVIPMRGGNGTIERLAQAGQFTAPTAAMLEEILARNLSCSDSLVTVDLWDWDKLRGKCAECSEPRRLRLLEMNLKRRAQPAIRCERCNVKQPGR